MTSTSTKQHAHDQPHTTLVTPNEWFQLGAIKRIAERIAGRIDGNGEATWSAKDAAKLKDKLKPAADLWNRL